MLCERCQNNLATVEVTLVVGQSDSHHQFCEFCYPTAATADSPGKAGWVIQEWPPKPLPTRDEIARFTTEEYFDAMAKANANSADKPVFKHIRNKLQSLPETQQRLTLEYLPRLWRALELGSDVGRLFGFWPAFWARSIAPNRLPEYLDWLEKISVRCFELLGPFGEPFPLRMNLHSALTAMYAADRERFRSVRQALRARCSGGESDQRRVFLADIERFLTRPGPSPSA